MDHQREHGGLRQTIGRLTEKVGRLFGRPGPVGEPETVVDRREAEVRRELRDTYDNPTDAIQARSGFRQ